MVARTILVAVAILVCIAGPMFADETSSPTATETQDPAEPPVDELLRQSGDTTGVWEKIDKNRAHHIQSGLVCEPFFFSFAKNGAPKEKHFLLLPLQSVSIVASDRQRGDDVACNYGSSDGPLAVIEAIRLKDGEDAGDILEETRKALASKYQRFHHDDLPIRLSTVEEGEIGKGVRFQHYNAWLDDKEYLATIWVGRIRRWAILVYAVGTSDNIILQHAIVNTQWNQSARWVLATSISRGEPGP